MDKTCQISFSLKGKSLKELSRGAMYPFDEADITEIHILDTYKKDRIQAIKLFSNKKRIINIKGIRSARGYLTELVSEIQDQNVDYIAIDFAHSELINLYNPRTRLIVDHEFKRERTITYSRLEMLYLSEINRRQSEGISRMFVNPINQGEITILEYFMRQTMPNKNLVVAVRGNIGRHLNFRAIELGAPFVCSTNDGDLPTPRDYKEYMENRLLS